MGTLFQRGRTYYAFWVGPDGSHNRKSLRTRDRQVALKRLRTLELGEPVDAAFQDRPTAGTPLSVALSGYLATIRRDTTRDSYTQKAGTLERHFPPDTPLSEITREMVEGYITKRRDRDKVDLSTVYKELVVLRRTAAYYGAETLLRAIPKVKFVYHPRTTYLSMEQANEVLAELPPHRRLWFGLAAFAGLNTSEVEGMQPEHVDLAMRLLRVHGTKTATRFRVVPISEPLVPLLGDPTRTLPVEHWGNVRRDLHAAVERVNSRRPDLLVPKISPNDLRRTFASILKQANVDNRTVADMLGHSSTRMVDLVYGKLNLETYRKAVDAAFGGAKEVGKRLGSSRSGPASAAKPQKGTPK